MKIVITSVLVDDQDKALAFYTEKLGFVKKTEFPAGEHRWLTVVPPMRPTDPSWCWSPTTTRPPSRTRTRWSTTASRARRSRVDDVETEHERLRALGVRFTQEPAEMGPVTTAVLDDTCGNLIQIASQA